MIYKKEEEKKEKDCEKDLEKEKGKKYIKWQSSGGLIGANIASRLTS